jgi:ABC-2 type transport system permease protein
MTRLGDRLGRRGRRLWALVVKESLQVFRDPSALLIAFVLPPVLLSLYGNAVSLDIRDMPIGVVLESDSAAATSLAAAYAASDHLEVTPARHRRELDPLVVAGKLKGYVVIPARFDELLLHPQDEPAIQIVTDATQPNTASFTAGYSRGVFNTWLANREAAPATPAGGIELESRFWFNAELETRRTLMTGAIAIVMTLVGTMLTALVVAREWERGTMEAMMSTPASMLEILFSKLAPYFVLGIGAIGGCVFLVVVVYGQTMRGSMFAMMLVSMVFLVPALGQGLLISTLAKNQFLAVQGAVTTGFLPAMLLSGFCSKSRACRR